MSAEKLQIVHTNFIKAMNLVITEEQLGSYVRFAEWLGVGKQAIYSIMHGRIPTMEIIMTLCEKGGFNANWMLFDIGEPKLQEQNDIDKVMKELRAIKAKIYKIST